MMAHPLQALLDSHPLVAILRGIRPEEAVDVAEVLLASGFRCIEVPLNSPSPLESLNRLAAKLGDQMILGAGTVLNAMQVDEVVQAGAKWVLAPNCNRSMIERAVDRGLLVMPGVATPTEAFDALDAGAQALKLFPADVLGPGSLKAWRAVLPEHTPMWVVGGVDETNLALFRQAGARGAGLGSALYKPGIPLAKLEQRAQLLQAAWSGR